MITGKPRIITNLPVQAQGFTLIAPSSSAYDSWSSIDNMPYLYRTDMGSGDWAIETWLLVTQFMSGQNFHTGLAVNFGTDLNFFYGWYQGTKIQMEKSGTGNILSAAYTSQSVGLKIVKSGTTYTFYYKQYMGGGWTVLGTYTMSNAVVSVGLFIKTWSAINVTSCFDYFVLDGVKDSFLGGTLASYWTFRRPIAGPSYLLDQVVNVTDPLGNSLLIPGSVRSKILDGLVASEVVGS